MNNNFFNSTSSAVSREIYHDEKIYQQELKYIFSRCWLFVAHESQIPKANDFVMSYMGEDEVIVSRDEENKIHVFINSCSHRGARVCQALLGNTKYFRCPYHGWTYRINGEIAGVPFRDKAYESLCLDLPRAAKVETFRGFIFASFNPDVESLEDYLGEMKWYIDSFAHRRENGIELIPGIHKWRIRCNWKIPADNHSGDMYHVMNTHLSALETLHGVHKDKIDPFDGTGFQINPQPGKGHGLGARYNKDQNIADEGAAFPIVIKDYTRQTVTETEKLLGTIRSHFLRIQHLTVFPNFFAIPSQNTIRIAHPKGPNEIEYWSFCYADKDAPADVKKAIRDSYVRCFGPSGIFEVDDAHNWVNSHPGRQGEVTRQQQLNYRMGLNSDFTHPDMPGVFNYFYSDLNQRDFYVCWQQYMQELNKHE